MEALIALWNRLVHADRLTVDEFDDIVWEQRMREKLDSPDGPFEPHVIELQEGYVLSGGGS